MIFSTNASITANGSPGKSHSRIMGYNKVIQTPIQATSQRPCCFLNWLSLLWVCCVKTPVNQSKGSPVTHSLLLRLNLFPTVGKLVKSGGVGCHIYSTKHTVYSGYIQVCISISISMYNLSVRALVQSTCYKYAASQGVADYPALSFVLVLVHVLLYFYMYFCSFMLTIISVELSASQ